MPMFYGKDYIKEHYIKKSDLRAAIEAYDKGELDEEDFIDHIAHLTKDREGET